MIVFRNSHCRFSRQISPIISLTLLYVPFSNKTPFYIHARTFTLPTLAPKASADPSANVLLIFKIAVRVFSQGTVDAGFEPAMGGFSPPATPLSDSSTCCWCLTTALYIGNPFLSRKKSCELSGVHSFFVKITVFSSNLRRIGALRPLLRDQKTEHG